MENPQKPTQPISGETNKFSPTKISGLALEFLTLCEGDSVLMKRVYTVALGLLGESSSELVQEKPVKTGKDGGTPDYQSSNNNALTPDEARQAREEFRLKMGLSKLNPQQAKMAKAIFREKKKNLRGGSSLNAVKAPSPKIDSGRVAEPKKVQDARQLPVESQRKPPKGDDQKQLPGIGTKSTWTTKVKQQRQRALERSLDLLDDSNKNNPVKLADYYNARLTLEDTWERYQNTFEWTGKKNPLEDLLPLPNADDIREGLKGLGVNPRQHGDGHFILQDEKTGQSLREKF